MSPPAAGDYTPSTVRAQEVVDVDGGWQDCPVGSRILLTDSSGTTYRSCLQSGVIVPTIALGLNELAALFFPDDWSLLTGP